MEGVRELLDCVCNEIKSRNITLSDESVPLTTEFFDYLTGKYNLIPFTIPRLVKMLIDSHMIVSFPVIEADRRTKARRNEGYVIADTDIIGSLIPVYEETLKNAYAQQFGKRYNIERIMQEFIPLLDKYNNTDVGKAATIVLNLRDIRGTIIKNAVKYSEKWRESQIAIELKKAEPLSYYMDTRAIDTAGNEGDLDRGDVRDKRSGDQEQTAELKKHAKRESIESTLAVYGIEFYTRVCFKDYQYALIQKLVDQGVIKKKQDLAIIKRMLQKERQNADHDPRINEYAADINSLEKVINGKLKEG